MKKHIYVLAWLFMVMLTFIACQDDKNEMSNVIENKQTIELTNYFIGGTLGGSSKSVFVVQFLENNKALFIDSSTKYSGRYRLEDKLLTIEVNDPRQYRIMRFLLDDNQQIKFSYYQALDNAYLTQAALIKVADTNQLAGKRFVGSEYRMGRVNIAEYQYRFDENGVLYGADSANENIVPDKRIELINPSVFRYIDGRFSILGFTAGDSLTVFKNDFMNYFGVFKAE